MDNSSSLFDKFKRQDSGVLTSCGAELQELMHQIDVMVRHKKMEWEAQFHEVEDKLEVREQELINAKSVINQKHKEVAMLTNKLESYEIGNRDINSQHERNINHLKSELNRLKSAYANLQKHYHKKSASSAKEKVLSKELDSVKDQLQQKIDNEVGFSKKETDGEVQKKVMQHQIECLESQRKSFAQKCERIQQQLLVYQSRLKRSNELVEEVELSSQSLVKKLEAELIKDKDLIQRQEELILELQGKCRELDNVRKLTVNEKYKLQEEIDRLSCELRTLSDETHDLKANLSIRDSCIKDGKHEVVALRNRVSDLENMLHVKQQLIESLQLRSPKAKEEDLKKNMTHLQSLVESYRNAEVKLREENDNLKKDLGYSREQIAGLTKNFQNNELLKISGINQEIRNLRGKVDDMEMSHTMKLCGLKADVTNISSKLAKKDINIDALGQTCKVINHKLEEESQKRNILAHELTLTSESLNAMCQKEADDIGPIKETFAKTLNAAQNDFCSLKRDYMKAVKTLEEENKKLEEQVKEVRAEVANLAQNNTNTKNGNELHGETSRSKPSNFRDQKNESVIKQYLEHPPVIENVPSSRQEFFKSIGVTSSTPSVDFSMKSDSGSKLTVNAIFGLNRDDEDQHENEAADKFMEEEEPKLKDLENRIDNHIKNMQLNMQATIQKLMVS